MKVQIIEVGPRDGLQNEPTRLSLEQRAWLVTELARAGHTRIEMGAFVSAKWVPQMENSGFLFKQLKENTKDFKKVRLSALVPNAQGMTDALNAGVTEVAVFGACSETFSRKNINCSIEDGFQRFSEVIKMARPQKIKVRGYLSTVFGCPYEGPVSLKRVIQLVERMLDLGVFEVSIGDTIGVATPKQVKLLLKSLNKTVSLKKLAMHFHDTRGTALVNVLASLDAGVRQFDSSVGGLGGCPYARGASGNLATEDLIYLLTGMGISTGVKLENLLAMRERLESFIGRKLPGRMMQAGLPKAGILPRLA